MTPEELLHFEDLSKKTSALTQGFQTFVEQRLQEAGALIARDYAENSQNWKTVREFFVACAQEYAELQMPAGIDKSRNHRIKQYRNLMARKL